MINKKIIAYLYVYIGTIMYVLASYYHLSIKDWSFSKAFMIALPLVCIEYFFSLQGNKNLNQKYNVNPIEILLITMCFYFINTWLLNYFFIKNKINTIKELLSLFLILCAFFLSANIKLKN